MFPMNGRPISVVVEYDSRGQRASKQFDDLYESRRFYVAKDKAGKNPKVRKAQQEQQS